LGFWRLVDASASDALRRGLDGIRSMFFYLRQTGLLAIHQLFEPFAQIL
jgi:hypothetical protein